MIHFYQQIPGWFSFRTLYAETVRQARDGAHFVEVGSWKGRSAAFMAVEIINSGKRIRFDCVDTWLGSKEPKHESDPSVKNGTLFEEFCRNTTPVKNALRIIRQPSIEAARLYEPGSLDFVFIDAAHDYDNVRADIAAWWPKVTVGGDLAGDDALFKGVSRAIDEAFPQQYRIFKGNGTGMQWRIKKERARDREGSDSAVL